MDYPKFNSNHHVLFVGNIKLYQVLHIQWVETTNLFTQVSSIKFALQLINISYFTHLIVDLDSCTHEDITLLNTFKKIQNYAIATRKKALILPKDLKQSFTNIYFFDENYDYLSQPKNQHYEDDFYQKNRFYQTRKFQRRLSKLFTIFYRFILFFSITFISIFLSFYFLNFSTHEITETSLSTKVSQVFYKTIDNIKEVSSTNKIKIDQFSVHQNWDELFNKTNTMSNQDLLNIKNQLPDSTIQFIKNNLSQKQKNELRNRFR
ncbi:MAG: hypothetical protein COB02_15355 [Candidatus Cloacimonadota bacterium]|nr:MAG: hypothetical protein COB02_15355 [Candidatus Cloacimonadota bacterium]